VWRNTTDSGLGRESFEHIVDGLLGKPLSARTSQAYAAEEGAFLAAPKLQPSCEMNLCPFGQVGTPLLVTFASDTDFLPTFEYIRDIKSHELRTAKSAAESNGDDSGVTSAKGTGLVASTN